jgi:hypothetical protein
MILGLKDTVSRKKSLIKKFSSQAVRIIFPTNAAYPCRQSIIDLGSEALFRPTYDHTPNWKLQLKVIRISSLPSGLPALPVLSVKLER